MNKKIKMLALVGLISIYMSGNSIAYMNVDNIDIDSYHKLSDSIVLPEDFDGSEDSYNNLPSDTKSKLKDLEGYSNLFFEQARKNFKYMPKSFESLRKGDILVTKDSKTSGWHHGHAAMLLDGNNIVEADGKTVTKRSYRWKNEYNTAMALTVDSVSREEAHNAAIWAYGKRGTPYGIHTNPNRTDRFYCSQLVYRSYLSATKSRVKIDGGSTHIITPMDLVRDDDTRVIARKNM